MCVVYVCGECLFGEGVNGFLSVCLCVCRCVVCLCIWYLSDACVCVLRIFVFCV